MPTSQGDVKNIQFTIMYDKEKQKIFLLNQQMSDKRHFLIQKITKKIFFFGNSCSVNHIINELILATIN